MVGSSLQGQSVRADTMGVKHIRACVITANHLAASSSKQTGAIGRNCSRCLISFPPAAVPSSKIDFDRLPRHGLSERRATRLLGVDRAANTTMVGLGVTCSPEFAPADS